MSFWTRLRDWCATIGQRLFTRSDVRQAAAFDAARQDFHQHREWLEAKFFDLAANSGKPRGLRWTDIDFENNVTYARQVSTKELCAFVGVTISFEAIEGGPMEDVEAVGNKRAATAVFRLNEGAWATDGRVLFNLSPAGAIEHFRNDLVLVGEQESSQ